MELSISKQGKVLRSENYNYIFNSRTGFFVRWGKTADDDPQYSPFGPEILDLEISVGGDCMGNCPFCYKSNGGDQPTHNMTLEEFKIILEKMPSVLTQIAFGIMNVSTNPQFFDMMRHARQNGIVPNYTCHGLDVDKNVAELTSELCGAVAVSLLNQEKTFDSIKMFSDAGMKQVNIHYLLSEETYDRAFQVIEDISKDNRTNGLNAIVFLQYKSKGRNPDDFNSVRDIDKYKRLIEYCDKFQIGYGFDSCSGPLFMDAIADKNNKKFLEMMAEPCESGLFSSYINCYGKFVYCSFAEGIEEEMDVLNCNDFLQDIWFNEKTINWRKRLLQNNRCCPIYDLAIKK